jgi:hypothetical protein
MPTPGIEQMRNDFLMTYQRVKREYDAAEQEALRATEPAERAQKFVELNRIGAVLLGVVELLGKVSA